MNTVKQRLEFIVDVLQISMYLNCVSFS